MPPGFESETQGFSTILEDFVVKVFLRQLDEKVTAGFQKAVSGYDAYQVDRGVLADTKQRPLKVCQKVFFWGGLFFCSPSDSITDTDVN